MVLHHPEKTACHDRKRRQEVEFEHIRRTYNIRKAVVVQCRVQRSRVLERNVVGILPLSGKSLQDCLCLQAVPKECVRYRWSVLFHIKFDLSPIPDEVLMPSSGEKFQFVYGDSRKSGRIIATSEPFKFGLEDDLTELGGRSKLKKDDSLRTPYLELPLNSNWNNNNVASSEDGDEDDKEFDVGLGDSSGSDKEDDDGNCLTLPTIDEETLSAIPYTENTAAPATEDGSGSGSNLVASAEDEYVFVAAEDMTRQCLSDDVSDQHSLESENVRDIKIDGKMGLSKFEDQPTFNWADSTDDTLVKVINGTDNSSTTTTSEKTVESPSNDTGNDAQEEQNDPTNVMKNTLDTHAETQQTLKSKSAARSAEDPSDAAESETTSTESVQSETLPDAGPILVATVQPETGHQIIPNQTTSFPADPNIDVKNKSAEDAATDQISSLTIQATDEPKQDIEPQVSSATVGVSANNDQPTQYVQYSTADGDVCWGVPANHNWSASSVPVITTNQHMVIDVYNLGERLCALETQWGQWIPYLNSKIDHLTNCHQLLFDDCNVQKANISDLSERIHYQQSNGGGHHRGSWASRQNDRRYGGYRNRNADRERRYNEESKEVVGYYEYYKNQFNRPFGRGRGNYRRDRRDNDFYRKQDDTRYGYYYQNRQYETAENQERGQRFDDENHSEEDEKTEKEESRFDFETRHRNEADNVHAQHTQGSDQHNDLEEERVVIIPKS